MERSQATACATAPGNLFLLGEHAVVYGRPALISAVDLRATVWAALRSDNWVSIDSDSFGQIRVKTTADITNESVVDNPLSPLVRLAQDLISRGNLDVRHTGIEVRIQSEIPARSGLSSSSAVLCATACSVSKLLGLEMPREKYYDLLYPFQVLIHGGRASGAEIISSTFGKTHSFLIYDHGRGDMVYVREIEHAKLTVVIGDTRINRPTAVLVGTRIPELMRRSPSEVTSAFDAIAQLATQGTEALRLGDEATLAQLINKNHEILRDRLRVSTEELDRCVEASLGAGAMACKLSGAGGGGVVFALTKPEHVVKVKEAMVRCAAVATVVGVSCGGVSLI